MADCRALFPGAEIPGTPHAAAIGQAGTPKLAKELGRTRKFPPRADWEEIKDELMRRAVLRKFELHAGIRSVLLSTAEAVLIENAPTDYYWGCGKDGSGRNRLGEILMEVRAELRGRAGL